jgi:4-carboxymuconolactone decarboxylase
MRLPPSDCTPAAVSLLDFVFARVWQRPAWSRRDRRFIVLPCVAVTGAETPLRDHVCAALGSDDVTIIEIR